MTLSALTRGRGLSTRGKRGRFLSTCWGRRRRQRARASGVRLSLALPTGELLADRSILYQESRLPRAALSRSTWAKRRLPVQDLNVYLAGISNGYDALALFADNTIGMLQQTGDSGLNLQYSALSRSGFLPPGLSAMSDASEAVLDSLLIGTQKQANLEVIRLQRSTGEGLRIEAAWERGR